MIRWREFIVNRISARGALSQRVFLPVLSLLTVGSVFSESAMHGGSIVSWATVAIIALACSAGVSIGLGLVINVVLSRPGYLRFVAVLVVYFAVEAARAATIAWLALERGLDPAPNWSFRVVSGGLTGLALFTIVASILNESDRFGILRAELQSSVRQLSEVVSTTESELALRRATQLEAVRVSITDAVREVLNQGGATAREVADELVRISSEVVRPLSHRLVDARVSDADVTLSQGVRNPAKVNAREVLRFATFADPFRPELTLFLGLTMSLGSLIFLSPLDAQLWLVMSLLWAFGVLWLMRKFVRSRLERLSVPTRVVTLTFIYALAALVPSIALVSELPFGSSRAILFSFYMLGIAESLFWSLAILGGLGHARSLVIDVLRSNREKLQWQRARTSMKMWAQQNSIAVALHKDVQGALLAAAMQLKTARESNVTDAEAIAKIRGLVLESTDFLMLPRSADSFSQSIEELNRKWSGIFRLDVDGGKGSAASIRRVDSDAVALVTLVDLLAELVTNAIKHGRANTASVSLSMVNDMVVRLEVTNNGIPVSGDRTEGFGARMMTAVALANGIENVPGGVRVWIDLPVT